MKKEFTIDELTPCHKNDVFYVTKECYERLVLIGKNTVSISDILNTSLPIFNCVQFVSDWCGLSYNQKRRLYFGIMKEIVYDYGDDICVSAISLTDSYINTGKFKKEIDIKIEDINKLLCFEAYGGNRLKPAPDSYWVRSACIQTVINILYDSEDHKIFTPVDSCWIVAKRCVKNRIEYDRLIRSMIIDFFND